MNNSILDQIIDKQKTEEVAKLNAVEIVDNLSIIRKVNKKSK